MGQKQDLLELRSFIQAYQCRENPKYKMENKLDMAQPPIWCLVGCIEKKELMRQRLFHLDRKYSTLSTLPTEPFTQGPERILTGGPEMDPG